MALETLRSRIAGKELFARAAEYDSEGNKISTSLESKQDVISDIEEIRSGAAAGATAYQKPNTGIPSSDMMSEVQTSLGLADSAVQGVKLAGTQTPIPLDTGNIVTIPTFSTSAPGLVPSATSADADKALRGDGTWGDVSSVSVSYDAVNEELHLDFSPQVNNGGN